MRQENTRTPSGRDCVAACSGLGAACVPATAADLTWENVNADWTVGTNWTPDGPPGVGDVAIINGFITTLNSDTTILGLNEGGGTISGTGALTVTGPSIWTVGTHTGAGITNLAVRWP